MYRINDKAAAIKEIQRYLRVVVGDEIVITPNGIYDDVTRLGVIYLQDKYRLNKSGVVDMRTFDLLYAEYKRIIERESVQKEVGAYGCFPFKPGDLSPFLAVVGEKLACLLDHYGVTHDLLESSYYSLSLSEAVKEIRKIYLLEPNDLLDEELYSRLTVDYNSLALIC